MTKIRCGKCIACTKFNGSHGNGYQPCHNPKIPVPPQIPAPPIRIIGCDDRSTNSSDSYDWLFGLFCVYIGIAIGIWLVKII